MSTHDDLRAIALAEFASAGYAATSLQRIAEIAGLSKSSVLYHYDSKEALLEASLAPAIANMEVVLETADGSLENSAVRTTFIEGFVDVLFAHRLEISIFINQAAGLQDVPVMHRAETFIARFAELCSPDDTSIENHLRVGVALGGAAYVLSGIGNLPLAGENDLAAVRTALVTIISELLIPLSAQLTTH